MTGGGSIAGYQPKTTLALIDGQWMDAYGGAATTHILKPLPAEHAAVLHSENYCLSLGRWCELVTFSSEVADFDGSPALVIERYDREMDSVGNILRIHQEDASQALSLSWNTDSKFESIEPFQATLANVASLMTRKRRVLGGGPDDRERLLAYTVFNVAVGNTDAHAKNFSMLHLADGGIELAPLYDVLPQILNPNGQLNLAMRINRQPFQPYVTKGDIVQEAVSCGIKEILATRIVTETLERLRLAVQDLDTTAVDEKIPLLIANQAKNLLNGKRAQVTSGRPIAPTKLNPVSAMDKRSEPEA